MGLKLDNVKKRYGEKTVVDRDNISNGQTTEFLVYFGTNRSTERQQQLE